MLPKRTKAQQSPAYAHYPFIIAKAKMLFIYTIQGKQPIKERTLDLESFGIGKEVKDIIKCLV